MSGMMNLGGQQIFFNAERKLAKTTINQPFYKAGKILNWHNSFGSVGLGLNKQIISFIIKTKSYLIIRVEEESKEYFINYDKIKEFIDHNNTLYKAGKVTVHVIPWSLTTRFPELRAN